MSQMLEIFSGSSNVCKEFQRRGWSAFSFDLSRSSSAQVIADARHFPVKKISLDFIWFSPPCNEFSKARFPWFKNLPEPSTELFETSLQLIDYFSPKLWLIENTKGGNYFISKKFSPANSIIYPWYFWTNLPNISKFPRHLVKKNCDQIKDSAARGIISPRIIHHIANQVETFLF